MLTKIIAKTSDIAPRELIIGNHPIYTIDRNNGYRLTIINRNTSEVVADRNFSKADDMQPFSDKYSKPPYITIIVGHGTGKVYINIKDPLTGIKVVRRGSKMAYATYVFWQPEKAQSPAISSQPKNEKTITQAGLIPSRALLLPIVASLITIYLASKGEEK